MSRTSLQWPSEEELFRRYITITPEEQRKEFWTARQLGKHTNKDESAIRRLANEGKLPVLRVLGTSILIHIPSLYEAYRNGMF